MLSFLALILCSVPRILSLSSDCIRATIEVSPEHHTYAKDGLEVSTVAFSSCHLPDDMGSVPNFWSDVRYMTRPDLWLWLGDNMYQAGYSDIFYPDDMNPPTSTKGPVSVRFMSNKKFTLFK